MPTYIIPNKFWTFTLNSWYFDGKIIYSAKCDICVILDIDQEDNIETNRAVIQLSNILGWKSTEQSRFSTSKI